MNFENSNNGFSVPQYSLPPPFGGPSNNYSGLGQEISYSQNSVEFTTNANENGAPEPLEFPSFISEPVDDYSLHYVYSEGIQYCANLKKKEYNIHRKEGNTSSASNYIKPTVPIFIEQGNPNPNKLLGGYGHSSNYVKPTNNYVGGAVQGTVGAHNKSCSTYPGIDRYLGNMETFLRGSPRPRQIDVEAGGSQGMENSIGTQNFFHPKYYNHELEEVSKDEYLISLQRNKTRKDISNRGPSPLSMSKPEYNEPTAMLWDAQVCRDSYQAFYNTSIDSNSTRNLEQTGNTTGGFYNTGIQQGGTNSEFEGYPSFSTGIQGGANGEFKFGAYPSFNMSSGMENAQGIGEGSFVTLDMDYSAIWEDRNPLPPIPEDGILQDSRKNDFPKHDHQNRSCTNQVMDIETGQIDDFVNGLINSDESPNPPQYTTEEYAAWEESVEALDIFHQDQNEFSLGSEWTDDIWLANFFRGFN